MFQLERRVVCHEFLLRFRSSTKPSRVLHRQEPERNFPLPVWVSTTEAIHFLASQAYNLRALRLDKRLTQEQVAAKLQVSRSYYSEIERGVRPRDIPLALRTVNRMRTRTGRTDGGELKVGRELVA